MVSNPSDLPTDPEENGGPIGIAGLRPLKGVRRSLYATFAGRTLQPNGCLYRHWVVGAHLQCTVINNPYINRWSFHGMMSCKTQLETYSRRCPIPCTISGLRAPAPSRFVSFPPVLHLPFPSSALPLHLFDTDLVCSPGASSVSSRSSLKVGGRSGPAGFPTSPRIKCSEAREVSRHTYDLEARTRSQVQPSIGLSVSSQPILRPPSRISLFLLNPPSSPPPAPCFQNPASDGNPQQQKNYMKGKNMPIYRVYWGFNHFCSAGIIKQCHI